MKNRHHFILLGLCLIAFSRCTLDEGEVGSQNPALQLQAEANLSLITLSWTPVKVTGFKEYIILQSTGNIPDTPEPIVNQDVIVLTRINEVNVTSFSTANTLLSPTTCYKLYAHVDDRFLYSATVCKDQSITVLQGFYDRTSHLSDSPNLAMFNRLNATLAAYNVVDDQFTNSITEGNLSFPLLNLSVDQDQQRLITMDQGTSSLRRYSFPQLAFQGQKSFGETLIAALGSGPYVYVAVQNVSASFQVLNANTFSILDSKTGSLGSRNLAVFEGNPTTVLEMSDTEIIRYKIKPDGKILSTDEFSTGVSQVSSQNTCDYNSQYYIGGRLSTIVNRDGEIITSLESGGNTFTQFDRFSADGHIALVMKIENNAFELVEYDISNLPSFTKIKSLPLPSASYVDALIIDDIIYVIGVDVNSGNNTTFILKFPK